MKIQNSPLYQEYSKLLENKGQGDTRLYCLGPDINLSEMQKAVRGDRKDQILFKVAQTDSQGLVHIEYYILEADDLNVQGRCKNARPGETITVGNLSGQIRALE